MLEIGQVFKNKVNNKQQEEVFRKKGGGICPLKLEIKISESATQQNCLTSDSKKIKKINKQTKKSLSTKNKLQNKQDPKSLRLEFEGLRDERFLKDPLMEVPKVVYPQVIQKDNNNNNRPLYKFTHCVCKTGCNGKCSCKQFPKKCTKQCKCNRRLCCRLIKSLKGLAK